MHVCRGEVEAKTVKSSFPRITPGWRDKGEEGGQGIEGGPSHTPRPITGLGFMSSDGLHEAECKDSESVRARWQDPAETIGQVLRDQRDTALAERDTARAERDTARQERDELRTSFISSRREVQSLSEQRNLLRARTTSQSDKLHASAKRWHLRAMAAGSERDEALAERDVALAALADRDRSLGQAWAARDEAVQLHNVARSKMPYPLSPLI